MYIARVTGGAYNHIEVCKCLFERAMKTLSGTRPWAAVLAATLTVTAIAAHADPSPQTQQVAMRTPSEGLAKLPAVDHVVVHKADRRLYLMHGGTVVRAYKIALGLNPIGTKERAGDFRTPEGEYRLVRRNPRSDYFLSMQVSYPNATDLKHAKRNHWVPGGSIMVHGLPNQLKHDPAYYENVDWTDGCIAVSNADMLEIWLLVPDNAPIEIDP
jgi:murein L,D-transpeptidase YafK